MVDSVTGHVDHNRLNWTQAPVGPVLAEALGLPVSVVRLWDGGEHPQLPAWPGGAWRSSVYGSVWVPESVAQAGLWD